MIKFDYKVCEFISEEMYFFTYYDFCDNRKQLKKLYKSMSKPEQKFYMWYVYANIHCNETYKNFIWDYLNDYIDDCELLEKKKFYKAK